MSLYSGALYTAMRAGELIFGRKNTSICNFLNLLFFLFSSIKHVLWHFSRRARQFNNKDKVNNKDTRIGKVNDKIWNKDTVDVVLTSLLLTLNTFHFLLQCLYCWLWSVNCRLGLLFVVLMLCACWNQFRQSFHLWRIHAKKFGSYPGEGGLFLKTPWLVF